MSEFKYDTPQYWQQEIANAMKWRKQHSFEGEFNLFYEWFRHKFRDKDVPHFNLIYMLGSSLIPNLFFQRPTVIHNARRPEFISHASLFDGTLNFILDEIETESVFHSGILAAYLQNTVAFELGYDFPEDNPVGDMVFQPIPFCTDRARKTNMPWISVVPATEFLVASGTKNVRNCPWYARLITVPLTTLKRKAENDERIHKDRLEATKIPKEITQTPGMSWIEQQQNLREYVSFWHIHEQEYKTEFWLNTNGHIIMGPEDDPLQIDGLPVDFLQLNDDTETIWGTPDPHIVRSQQLSGDEIRQDLRKARRNSITKLIIKAGVFSKEAIAKLMNSKGTPIVEVDLAGTDLSIQDAIMNVDLSSKMEWHEHAKFELNDAQLLTGQGPNQQGTYAQGRRTAREVQVVEQNNLLRTGYRRGKIKKILENIGTKIDKLTVDNWTGDIVVKVLGVEGAFHWVKAQPSALAEVASELSTTVNIESLAPVSKTERRQEMTELLKAMSKIQGVNILPLLHQIISTFPWADANKLIPMGSNQTMGMQDFQQQQAQQMQNPELGQQASGNLQGLLSGVPGSQ